MKNTSKDRFEKKLIRFIREVDKQHDKFGRDISTYDLYMQHRDEIYKKYGFTDEEWNKACRLIRSCLLETEMRPARWCSLRI